MADLRMHDLWSAAEPRVDIDLQRAIDLAYLGQSDRGVSILLFVLADKKLHVKDYLATSDPFTGQSRCYSPQYFLPEWLAVDAIRRDIERGKVFLTNDHSDPALWARSFVQSIRSRCDALGIHWSAVPLAGEIIAEFAETAGSRRRAEGNQGAFLRIESHLTAFALELVRCYPDRSSSHIVLSSAHLQSVKNAWNRSRDADAIESLRKSRDAATKALGIEPMRNDVRAIVDDRERRLQRALAG